MFDALRRRLLRLLRVPPEPRVPAGSSASVRVFRAARRYYHYALFRWSLKQVGALIGIVVFLGMGTQIPQRASGSIPPEAIESLGPVGEWIAGDGDEGVSAATLVERLFTVAETVGLILFLSQIPFTYALVRLDYELRWYIVTDRSLRIREGIARVREMTMTFANIQNVTIRQGPLQRLLGIADVRVRTAGGGASESDGEPGQGKDERTSMHIGYFRGVDNAQEIRELIFDRLRGLKSAGLGDPDDVRETHGAGDSGPVVATGEDAAPSGAVAAALALLEEARALRAAAELAARRAD